MWKEAVILTAAAGCACLARSEYERKHFSVESVQMASGKLIQDRCLVFLSDLHNNEFGSENGKLVETIFRLKPDAVLVGGDYNCHNMSQILKLLMVFLYHLLEQVYYLLYLLIRLVYLNHF